MPLAFPSITTILGIAFLGYIGHSMWMMAQLFTNLKCSDVPCYSSFLASNPRMQLALFTSTTANPISTEVTKLDGIKNFQYMKAYEKDYEIKVPAKTRRNGTLHLQVVLALQGEPLEWKTLRRDGPTVIHSLSLTEYMVPKLAAFNLLGDVRTAAKMYSVMLFNKRFKQQTFSYRTIRIKAKRNQQQQ